MSKLVPIFVLSMVLAAAAEYLSVCREDSFGNRYYVYKNRLLIFVLALTMAVFVGLRTRYNDTTAYTHMYELIDASVPISYGINWLEIGDNPGFTFVSRALRHLHVPSQSYLMLFALATICIYIWFIWKYSDHIWFSVYLFITMGCYIFAMAAVKQCIAVAFCLIATDRAINKKYIAFVLWTLIASSFHAYSLMYLLLPVLSFKPWSKGSYFLLAITGLLGVSLQSLLGTIVNITSLLGEEYDVSSFAGDGVNIFRVAVVWAPVALSFFSRRNLQARDDRAVNLITNLSMISAMIMFIALFGTANYFARLANYFLIFQTITLPLVLNAFTKESKWLLSAVIAACYFVYFYYSTAIMYGGFDRLFDSIGLVEYLKQVF